MVKVGDLVTVLPAGDNTYLVVEYLHKPDARSTREDLGPLWALYNEEQGIGKMHEKWIEVINESRR